MAQLRMEVGRCNTRSLRKITNSDSWSVLPDGGVKNRVFRHLDPSGCVASKRLRSDEDGVRRFAPANHLPLTVMQAVIPAGGVPEAVVAQLPGDELLGLGGIAAEIEAVARGGELGAVGDEQIEHRGDGDAELGARIPQYLECLRDGVMQLFAAGAGVGVFQRRDDERVDPFAVGRSPDLRRKLRLHVGRKQRLRLREPGQIAVVREHQGDAVELEGVDVLGRDLDLGVVGHAAHVGEQAARADLLRQAFQVAVEHRDRVGGVGKRLLRLVG